jgi:hypothetical protein
MVTVDDDVAGLVANKPVMPVGQLDAAKVTGELKPFMGLITTVEVAVDPTLAVTALALMVKPGAALTVNEMVVLADRPPLVPMTVSG